MPGFVFGLTIAAHLDSSGSARGTVIGRSIDTSAFGVSERLTLQSEVRCMRVVGNTAWIGTRSVQSSGPGRPVGELGAAWVVDKGGNGEDIAYSGPSWFLDPEDRICSENPPPMPPVVAEQGNFSVR